MHDSTRGELAAEEAAQSLESPGRTVNSCADEAVDLQIQLIETGSIKRNKPTTRQAEGRATRATTQAPATRKSNQREMKYTTGMI
jgi:hypothetical protein